MKKLLSVCLIALFVAPIMAQTIVVDQSTSKQTIRGWEAVSRMLQDNYPTTYQNWQQAVLDGAVDVGINRMRVEIESGMENPTNYWQQYLDGQLTIQQAFSHKHDIINDNADPNVVNPNGFQWGWFDFKMTTTVLPLSQRLAAQGEQLYISVCYVDFGSSSFEHQNNPAEYGEFVLAVYQHMLSTFGIVPDTWEVGLEPDSSAANWTPEQMTDCVVAAQTRLLAAGFTPNFALPSTTDGAQAINWYNSIKARNPNALTYVSEVGYHRYGNISPTQLASLRDTVEADGKRTMMSEWIGATGHTLHTDLTVGNNSSWEQFVLASNIANGDNGAHLFMINPSTAAVTYGSRTKFLRQYFKWIRRGAVVKAASTTNPNFQPFAARNIGGNYTVVVQCATDGSFTIGGLPPGTYHSVYTTDSAYNQTLSDQTIGTGQIVSGSIPAAGVITIFATLGPTAAEVRVIGRVTNATGRGVSKARVSVTSETGETRLAITNALGYYSFEQLPAGAVYVFNVQSKSHTFTPQALYVIEGVTELNFTAQ